MLVEWVHIFLIIAGWIVGAAVGLVAGTWKLASTVAKIESNIRKDFSEREAKLYERIAGAIAEREARLGDLADQFDETLKGLRQKINDVELSTVKNFVARDEFDDFRSEYREDIRDIKKGIHEMNVFLHNNRRGDRQ